jgi:enoyl-CoA hydratase/carnithine racemase
MAVRGVEIERRGPVGWILINDYQATVEAGAEDPDTIGVHDGVGLALDELRWDRSVRVVVLTGAQDGEFYRFSRRSHWDDPRFRGRLDPAGWYAGAANAPTEAPEGPDIVRRPDAHEMLELIEKPVVARVNGDAIGFGQSLLYSCDLIIAREDAKIAWGHTGLGEIVDSDGEERGFPWPMTPSYGMAALLYMPPAKAREWLMLSKVYTAREMADMNLFNYAVPMDELDAKVDEIVQALLARPPWVLARTKRVATQHLRQQNLLAEQLSSAYGLLDLWQHGASGSFE